MRVAGAALSLRSIRLSSARFSTTTDPRAIRSALTRSTASLYAIGARRNFGKTSELRNNSTLRFDINRRQASGCRSVAEPTLEITSPALHSAGDRRTSMVRPARDARYAAIKSDNLHRLQASRFRSIAQLSAVVVAPALGSTIYPRGAVKLRPSWRRYKACCNAAALR